MNFEKQATKRKINDVKSVSKRTTNKVGIIMMQVFIFAVILLVVVGAGAGLGIAKAMLDSAPKLESIEALIPQGYTTHIYDLEGHLVQQLHTSDSNRIYVEIDQIPQDMKDAIVAIEDERFYEHNGVDARAMMRALVVNLRAGGIEEGASTITQQVIKNNVLSTEQTFERKITEQYLALQLEDIANKDQILELYLNTAPFGRGTLGVQSAANTYFNKDVSDLSLAECAVIAGITNLPTFYDPIINPENSRERQLDILNEMKEQGYISQSEYNTAINEPVYMNIQTNSVALQEQSDYSYFVDEVIKNVAEDLKIQEGYTETQAYNLIYSGGLSIYMTQDLEMQKIADDVYLDEENFPTNTYGVRLMYTLSVQTPTGTEHHYHEDRYDSEEKANEQIEILKEDWVTAGSEILAEKALYIPQPQSAFVLMDYYTGHVKVIVGGRGEKIGNQTFNRATQATRQPGSTFKVLAAYLPAIDTAGYTLGTIIDDTPFEVTIAGSGAWSPKNWYDRQEYNYWGLSNVKEGIRWSMNVLATKTLFDVGVDTAFDYLKDLGFTTLVEGIDENGHTDETLSLALGGLTNGVTVLELTAAYGAIANEGVYTEPILYTKVLDHDGAILIKNEAEQHRVMKDTTAFLLTDAMESVVISGTGGSANFSGMHVAGKTGTTSDNIDFVFAGYTPYYVAAIWLGYDVPKTMPDLNIHKHIWRKIMEPIHAGLEDKPFPKPDNIVAVTVCSESGKLVTEACEHDPRGSTAETIYYVRGTEPTEPCDVHVEATICTESGLFATEYCPEDTKENQVFIVRPEPLIPENWDPEDPPRIRDQQYELPASMAGEYCNIHGPDSLLEEELPVDGINSDGTPVEGQTTPDTTTPEDTNGGQGTEGN